MTETRVYTLEAAPAAQLEQALRAGLAPDADWRSVAHARFSVKAEGIVVTCYRSGKLVLQGLGLTEFAARWLPAAALAPVAPTDPQLAFERPTIGSDEAGKGDYFGPLVVAAVFAEPTDAAALRKMGVADSKSLGDRRMFPLAEVIERTFDHEIRALPPSEYNARHAADPNVNHLLADLHADAVAALLLRHPEAAVVVDRFGDEALVATRLRQRGARPAALVQVPRAEAHPVVAAASIVARIHFVEGIQRCQEEAGTDLHKGAGPPVDEAARRVVRVGGRELLGQVAKLHFRNTDKLPGGRP